MSKLKICVICGGASSEHDVSLVSATSVLKNLDKSKYEVYIIIISKQGKWFLYEDDIDLLSGGNWVFSPKLCPAHISPESGDPTIIYKAAPNDNFKSLTFDVVFPVLHGKNGEDGTIQGLFTLADIPFVGCDTLSSAMCMDKEITHIVLASAGIRTAKWHTIYKSEIENFDLIEVVLKDEIRYPMFIKPANAGSSVGVSKAHNKDELLIALQNAAVHDNKIIVEEFIDGIELECAVLGNDNTEASIVGEIAPCNEFYDYDAKYVDNKTELYIPARIPDSVSDQVRKIAREAYKRLGCSGLSRVDFFLTADNTVILNEINTIPGFTSISMYPKLFAEYGIPYNKLLDRLIELALEKAGK